MERITRTKAIRLKCVDCCGGALSEVKACVCRDCPLWAYRLGHEVDEEGNRITRRSPPKTAFLVGKNFATDDMEG